MLYKESEPKLAKTQMEKICAELDALKIQITEVSHIIIFMICHYISVFYNTYKLCGIALSEGGYYTEFHEEAFKFIEGNQVKIGEDFLPVGLTYKDSLLKALDLKNE